MLMGIRHFGYGTLDSGQTRQIIPGEVFARRYLRNDERLIELKFMQRYDGEIASHCDDCSRDFAADHYYDSHLPIHQRENPTATSGRPTKMEDDMPDGMLLDGRSGELVDPVGRGRRR